MIDILVFGAHPDDIEFGCGGIIAKMASLGKTIVMVNLSLGEKGTFGDPEKRRKECEQSAALVGAKLLFLDFKDCEIFDCYEGRVQLTKVIRQQRPRLVLAPLWKGEMNHPDHFACGSMVRAACRYSRFCKILPEIPVHWPEGILHYYPQPSCYDYVDFIIDVSNDVNTWKQMMLCHTSQMQSIQYDERSLLAAAQLGEQIGVKYAQGLLKGNPVVIDDPLVVAKATREL